MGIFSEIDMEMKQNDGPFSTDTNRPLDTASHSAPSSATQMEASDAFSTDERTMSDVTGQTVKRPEGNGSMPKAEGNQKAVKETQEQGEQNDGKVDEDAKRKAHEEAEAKRKAEFKAKQAAKKAAEKEQIARVSIMGDEEVMMASMRRIAADTEKLTRRNMKQCVSEHIQTKCLEDPDFARRAMHPRKSMIHCIWYINRKAREYLQEEMNNNEETPDANNIFGGDVPDEICYQWAVDYYNDPDAKEDQEKEEKFVPRPYTGGSTSSRKKTPAPKEQPKKEEKKPEPVKVAEDSGQMSLTGDFGFLKESA